MDAHSIRMENQGKHWLVHCFLDKFETLLLNKANLESMIKPMPLQLSKEEDGFTGSLCGIFLRNGCCV